MDSLMVKSGILFERHKKQDILVSGIFLKIVVNVLTSIAFLYEFLSWMIEFETQRVTTILILLILSINHQMFFKSPAVNYILSFLFIASVQARAIYLGLWKFPEFLGMYNSLSCLLLWHGKLEFIYKSNYGHAAIVVHTGLWIFFANYSGLITSQIPPDIYFALFLQILFQFVWYRNLVLRDYEDVLRRISLELREVNTKNLINAIPEGIVVLNKDLEVLMSNKANKKLAQGFTIFELKINEKFNNKQSNICEDLMKYVKDFKDSEDTTTNTFGICNVHNSYLEVTGSKTEWDNELAIVLTFREVTTIIKLETQVNISSKTLKILRGISHELKTPLNKIINDHQEFLHKCGELPDYIRKHIKMTLSASRCMLLLIRDMIDYSHIKFNNLRLNFSWLEVNDSILDSISMLKDLNSKYSITYILNTPEVLSVYTDNNRFKQCLINLFNFALG